MVNLGDLYIDGAGVPRDVAKGLALVRRAADRKQSYALNNLGFFMLQGRGVPKDPGKAVALFREAIEDEVPDAFVNLGTALNKGNGVERNQAEANRMFLKGAALGQPDGGYLYALNQYRGDGVTETDDEDEEDFERRTKEEARRWFGEAVKAGSTHAVRWLAWMQLKGEGGPANPGLALTTLALSGPRAKERLVLASLLKTSFGTVKPDPARARLLLEAAAADRETEYDLKEPWDDYGPLKDAVDSRHDLADMLERGVGGPKAITDARRYHGKAADDGDPRAAARFGRALLEGDLGGKPDASRAREILAVAVIGLTDDPAPALTLFRLLDRGIGGPKEPTRAAAVVVVTVRGQLLRFDAQRQRHPMLAAIRAASPETRAILRETLAELSRETPHLAARLTPWLAATGKPQTAKNPGSQRKRS